MAATLAAACFGERARPAPPRLELTLNQTTVQSPGSLTGTVRASDPDGIDSVWISLGQIEQGADGLFERDFQAPFDLPVEGGLPATMRLYVLLRGRDLAGFSGMIMDSVTVIP